MLGHEGDRRAPRQALVVFCEDAAHLVVDAVVVLDDAVEQKKTHEDYDDDVRHVKGGNAKHAAHVGDADDADDAAYKHRDPELPARGLVVLRQGADALLQLEELRLAYQGFHHRQKLRVVERGGRALVTSTASRGGSTVKVVHDRPSRGRRAAMPLTHPPVVIRVTRARHGGVRNHRDGKDGLCQRIRRVGEGIPVQYGILQEMVRVPSGSILS